MSPAAILLGILGAAFLSMGVYALLGRRPDADAVKRGSTFLLGAGNFLVHWFMWVITPVERVSMALGLGPDFFNFAGLFCGMASGLAIALGRLELGGWLIVLGGIADIMDGRMARALGLASDYGKFIDATLDRFVEVFVFLGFVVYLRALDYGPLAAAAAITGSLLVSYARARGESVGVLCREGLMQRAERLVLTCLVCLFDGALTAARGWPPGTVVLWTLVVIAAGTFWTAAYRTGWIAMRLRERARAALKVPERS
jgi:CDP-diacylglycerol--glycerol-3-phosphate 3-phosphatidyltransferase